MSPFILALLSGFISREVMDLLPLIEEHLPGFLKGFIQKLLATSEAQAKIQEMEGAAEMWLANLAGKGLAELEEWIVNHVKGNLGQALADAIAAQNAPVSLNASEVRWLRALQAAGKLDSTLTAAVYGLGITP